MTTKRRMIATDAVLVTCRPHAYFRDKATGRVHGGPQGRPGSAKYKPGSGPFRVSRLRYERDAGLPDGQRIFTQVGSEDESSN